MKRALTLAGLLASCTFACGGAPQAASPAATTAPSEDAEPTTVEEAVQQVERAKEALARPQPPATEVSPAAGSTSTHDAEKAPEECRALHSLERATQALCRLAGQDDPRCKDASQAVEQSRSRVKCP